MSDETARSSHELFRALIRTSAEFAGSGVLVDAHTECRYADLIERLQEIQRCLEARGAGPDQCVVVELTNSVRGALVLLALLDAGYSFLAMPAAGHGARAGAARSSDVAYPAFARVVITVGDEGAKSLADGSSPERYLGIRVNEQLDPDASGPEPGDPRLFFRTSGSLGTPKLASYRYDRFHAYVMTALRLHGFNPMHRIALPTPIFHGYGSGAALLPGLAAGASVDLQPRSNLLSFLEREAAFDPNVAFVTPSFCEALVRVRKSPRRYEFMVTGGDRISESALRRSEALHGTMVSQYGMTEMGIISACSVDMPLDLRACTVGRIVDGVEARIVPLPDVPDRDGGELQVRSRTGFDGYVDLMGKPSIPEGTFADGWYRTGDLAQHGPEGTLMVLGRCDLSVNRNGMLLALAEVESRMRDLSAVEEAAVALGRDTLRGRALIAFCTLRKNARADVAELMRLYAADAPPHAVPDALRVVTELPKLANGKIDRRALAALAGAL